MKTIIKFLSFVLLLCIVSCDTNEPPLPPNGEEPTLELELDDVSCTEAWITLTTTNLQLPTNLTLKQFNPTGDTIFQILNLNTQDSLLYIDSLLPNQTYAFITSHSGLSGISSNELSITTMDTTSHDFTFETFTFGGTAGTSTLYDVAIINENNIWAVGEIYVADTSQNGYTMYNAVHWDGNDWELKRVLYKENIWTITTIFAFNENDIWFSAAVRYDGQNFIELTIPPILMGWSINKIWGSSSDDLYVVGNEGNIAHYNGTSWQQIESGTETRINDVWGIISKENKTILYCPVSSFFVPGDKKILKIVDGKSDSVSWNRDVRLYSAWALNENILYACGEGIYVNKFGTWNQIDLYPVGTNSVRGNDVNDIFVVGDYGSIFHFNGVSWEMLSTPNNKGYSKVAVKGNIVVLCGNYQGQGLIEIGNRN